MSLFKKLKCFFWHSWVYHRISGSCFADYDGRKCADCGRSEIYRGLLDGYHDKSSDQWRTDEEELKYQELIKRVLG